RRTWARGISCAFTLAINCSIVFHSLASRARNPPRRLPAPPNVTNRSKPKSSNAPLEKNNMSIELKVPEIGESITEVEIGGWLKKSGEPVKKDEPVVTLESEKATVELPSPGAGTMGKLLKQQGETA